MTERACVVSRERSGNFALVTLLVGLAVCLSATAFAQTPQSAALGDLTDNASNIVLDAEKTILELPFEIAPGAEISTVAFTLVARPVSTASGGRLSVSLNGSRPIVLTPRAESFEAEFALYRDALNSGWNRLVLSFEPEGDEGWSVDMAESELQLELRRASTTPTTLDQWEAGLRADFAAPQRIHIDGSAATTQRDAVEALIAQGLALRCARTPRIIASPQTAERLIRAELGASGPHIAIDDHGVVTLSGQTPHELLAAARLFASRSFVGSNDVFTPSNAFGAPILGDSFIFIDQASDLASLAQSGRPFAAAQGLGAAVIIAESDGQARAASLRLLARAALSSGQAWIYARFARSVDDVPEQVDLLIIGPQATLDENVFRHAPPEFHAAARAARSRAQREQRGVGSTAYASENPPALRTQVVGLATVFETPDGRSVAVFTAPEAANFSRAASRLSQTGLWSRMDGRAAVWSADDITSFRPNRKDPASIKGLSRFIRDHDRWLALMAFLLSAWLMMIGLRVNRTSS
ncbi:MAG: hypothetical protein AAFX09_00035 [Pseudomonadota bacterium]